MAAMVFARMLAFACVAGLLIGPAIGQTAPPESEESATNRAVQQAEERLGRAYFNLASTISDCNGGSILVVACAPKAGPRDTACHEPVGSCGAVAAFRSTKEAWEELQKVVPVPARPVDVQAHPLRAAYEELAEASNVLSMRVSDCYGGTITVRACGPLLPARPGVACREAVSSCEVLAAFRATNVALAELKKVPRP